MGNGYAYLDGGNLKNGRSEAVEAYYRLALNDFLALTGDVQCLEGGYVDADDVEGCVLSMRAVVEL